MLLLTDINQQILLKCINLCIILLKIIKIKYIPSVETCYKFPYNEQKKKAKLLYRFPSKGRKGVIMKSKQQSFVLRGIVLIVGLLLLGGVIYYANQNRLTSEVNPNEHVEYETGRIVAILEDNTYFDEQHSGVRLGNMVYQVEMLGGFYEGELMEAIYFFTNMGSVLFDVGDRVSVRINTLDGEIHSVDINSMERTEILVGLVIVFLLVLAVIGGKRGIMSVAGLVFTMICIIYLLIPLMLKGYPVILTTIVILSLVTIVVLVLLGGVTPKTIAAILGCMIGVISAAIIAGFVGSLASISGFNMEDVGSLMFAAERNGFELQPSGLFISGVLIASLGAVMDTAMSITSALEEIKENNPDISDKQLFKSGMNVGRDIMGTMSNTLILAFTGTALNMMMFMYADNTPFNQLINNDFIAVELIRSIAGSLGIVLTVPAVAFIGSKLFITKSTSQ